MNNNFPPKYLELFGVFLKIGLLSFGGPAAQIALMHKMLVDEKKWLTETQYLNALSFCMFLPGPEAMQLATYSGWRLKGVFGGLIGGLLFVLPGAIIMLVLAIIYAFWGEITIIGALFLGVKATVLIIVIEALLRVSKRALNGQIYWFLALASFVGIFFLAIPYPFIVLAAAVFGLFIKSSPVGQTQTAPLVTPSILSSIKQIIIWLIIWWFPILIVQIFFDIAILTQISNFFSKLAVVTFGGAYAVLAYMGQDVVDKFNWLTAGEMMDGLGLAETTPGPLILVTEFVGFLAGFKDGGLWLGISAALLTLWVTFIPCFLWIFVGAPYIDWISNQPRLKGALSAITAAVVGVILNLSIWFGLHILFTSVTVQKYGWLTLSVPEFSTLDYRVLSLAAVSGLLLLKLQTNIIITLVISGLLGALAVQF